MTTWLVIVAVGLGSFVFRLGPQLLFERVSLPARVDGVVRHGGVAAITALIVVSTRQSATGHAVVPMLLAMAAAVALAVRGASIVRLLVVGGGIYAVTAIVVGLLA